MKKILHLTLKKQWFDAIKSGEKKKEYRNVTRWSIPRLWLENEPRPYDLIEFRNGYSKTARRMVVEYLDCVVDHENCQFVIYLGRVLHAD
jgi:hypothetical protein